MKSQTENVKSCTTRERDQFPPPAHLSPRAAALWRAVVPARARSQERLALVQTALESYDRAEAARVAIEAQGMIAKTETTGAIHVHPLVKVEREARQQFSKIWGQLSLQWNQRIDGAPDGKFVERLKEQTDDILAELAAGRT